MIFPEDIRFTPVPHRILTDEQRSDVLDRELYSWVREGWAVESRSDIHAVLIRTGWSRWFCSRSPGGRLIGGRLVLFANDLGGIDRH